MENTTIFSREQTDAVIEAEEKPVPKAIGGWLILVGIKVVLAPFLIAAGLYQSYLPIFLEGAWTAIVTPDSPIYNPSLGAAIIEDVAVRVIFMFACVFAAFLFFTKKRVFPKWCIGLLIFAPVYIFVDAWVASFFAPDEPMLDTETMKALARALVAAIVWTAYLLKSKRVKETFIV